MNRRQKIIVSITGIFIVLLALVGLTYAYFLTKITGNENEKSVSVTTANLVLEYADGNGRIAPTEVIEPGYIATKTFSAKNKGNSTVDYVVVFEDVVNEISRHPDLVYTLTCEVYSKNDINTDGTLKEGATKTGDCNGISETNFPRTTDLEIVVRNSVAVDYANYYVLTIHYKEMNIDQSVDMNKTFEAHVNIKDPNEYNPYNGDKNTLAYNVINNSITGTNGTKYRTTPLTKVAEETNVYGIGIIDNVPLSEIAELSYSWYDEDGNWYCSCTNNNMIGITILDGEGYFLDSYLVTGCNGDEPIVGIPRTAIESSLSLTDDTYTEDTEIKSYYYRGNVEDNYVTFSGMCWRIVRINGDGSIKVTLESQSPCSETMISDISIGKANWGYKDEYIGDYKNSTSGMKNALTTWLNETEEVDGEQVRKNITTTAEKWIKTEEWCLGNVEKTYNYTTFEELTTTASSNYASNTYFYYETGRNLHGKGITPNATLICNGETDSSKIGALTADEVVFAGGKVNVNVVNNNYYLHNNESYGWWTLSRSFFDAWDSVFYVDNYGGPFDDELAYLIYDNDVRPAVSLKTGVKILSGEGTKQKPYIINEA